MFGKNSITDALARGDISISYDFDLSTDIPARLPTAAVVDPHDPDALAMQTFQRHFFGDRLGLTLGPIVVSESIREFPGRVLFKGRAGHFDLRQSNGEIEIMPGEGLAAHSVEYVRLGARTAAYILPRLTLATAGLAVIPTYIDPYWEGILQLYITNLSPHPYRLKFGERIAICRFYGVEGAEESAEIKSQFAKKSHHYGLNWPRILDSDFEVQPRRKHHVPAALYRERLRIKAGQFITKWHNVSGLAAGAALIAAIFAYAKFESKASQIDSLATQVKALKSDIEGNAGTQKDLDRDFPQGGSLEIRLGADQQRLTQEIPLQRRPAPQAYVWVFPATGNTPIAVTGKIYCGSGMTDCKLRVTADRSPVSHGVLNAQIKWLILGR